MTKFAGRGIVVSFEGTEVGQLHEFGEVGSSRGLIDASVYGDDWVDVVLGQQDGAEVAAVVLYDPAETGHGTLRTSYDTNPDGVFTLNLAHADAGVSLDVTCRITTLTIGGALGGLFQMSLNFKIVSPGVVDAS